MLLRVLPYFPKQSRVYECIVEAATRVFTQKEIHALEEAADTRDVTHVGLSHGLFIRTLFRTGLRIGAVASMRWKSFLRPLACGEELPIGSTALLREKGGTQRFIVLDDDLRRRFHVVWESVSRAHAVDPEMRVFPFDVRTLRNAFYRLCHAAGISGQHCHPHAARHTLAHMLYLAGNPISLIAKFLGHKSLVTTNQYYLRLEFH